MRFEQNENYRREGTHLYKLVDGQFVHVYQDAFCTTLSGLIKSYEKALDDSEHDEVNK